MMGRFSFIYFALLCCLGVVGMLILERVSFDGLLSLVGMVGYCARTRTHKTHAIGLNKHILKIKVRCRKCINS